MDALARAADLKAQSYVSPQAIRATDPSFCFPGERTIGRRRVQVDIRRRRAA